MLPPARFALPNVSGQAGAVAFGAASGVLLSGVLSVRD
jgi:hypothetical protein